MRKYNLNQLKVLRHYFDDPEIHKFLEHVNPSYSCNQLEALAQCFKMGIYISDLSDCYMSYDCLMLLCDAKMKGIDIKGLCNEFIDSDLLKQILNIKKKNPDVDMSFIEDLSLKECKNLVDDYRLYGVNIFKKYQEKIEINKKMITVELEYILGNTKKI